MSTSWQAPEAVRTVTGTAFGVPYSRTVESSPPLVSDLMAGLVAVVACVLAGAPVGLLWATLAPRVPIVLRGQDALLRDVYGDGRIAADAYFVAAVALAGIVSGALAWWLGRRHGPAVVAGLAVGGLAAAAVAMLVGQQVGLESLRQAVQAAAAAGKEGSFELTVDLMSREALAVWPVAALLTYILLTLTRDRGAAPVATATTAPVSSG